MAPCTPPRGVAAALPPCPQSQAAAHYQGNRHARRLKGLEAARARRGGDTGDNQDPPAPTPNPTGETPERKGGSLHLEVAPGVLVSPQGDVRLLGSLLFNPPPPHGEVCVCGGGGVPIHSLCACRRAAPNARSSLCPWAPFPPRSPSCGRRGTGGDAGGTWGCNGGGGGRREGEGQAAALLCPLQGGCQLPVPARGTQ